jgi:hypothetical protein
MKIYSKIALVALSLFASVAFAGQLKVNIINNTDTDFLGANILTLNVGVVSVPGKIPAHGQATMIFENESTVDNPYFIAGVNFVDVNDNVPLRLDIIAPYFYVGQKWDPEKSYSSPVQLSVTAFNGLTSTLSDNTWDRDTNKTVTQIINGVESK